MSNIAVLRRTFGLCGSLRRGLWLACCAGVVLAVLAPHEAPAALRHGPAFVDPLRERWQQVRIEQHWSIRIAPGAPVMPADMLDELQQTQRPEHFDERPIGKCVAIGAISAVQSGEGNRLLFFMRDQHIISAALEKACRAHDFYSGFYIARNGDGLLCTDRDKLQSRTGANCRIKRLKVLIGMGGRR